MYNSDIRILKIIDLLEFRKLIKDPSEFCDKIDLHRQTLSKIKKDKGHFTPEYIEIMCNVFNLNPACIFGFEKNVFRNDKTIVIDIEIIKSATNKNNNNANKNL